MLEESALVNVASCVKRLECSDKVGKRYIRTTPFTIHKAAYLSGISTEMLLKATTAQTQLKSAVSGVEALQTAINYISIMEQSFILPI